MSAIYKIEERLNQAKQELRDARDDSYGTELGERFRRDISVILTMVSNLQESLEEETETP